jgi:aminocarboxymuconate-semialdehyde decarboxylase
MTIDVHAHVVVPEITRAASPGEEWRPDVRVEDGRQVVAMGDRAVRALVNEIVDADGILAAQDAAGVDRVVLSPFVPLLYYDVEPAAGLERCRIQNDALTRIARRHPERVSALGAVPLQDPELAATELTEVMARGELAGVEIAASVRGVYLGDDRFEPFWAAAEDTGAIVFIHPTTRGFDDPVFTEYYLWNAVGNPVETTVTAAHMVLSGVMERHPGLRVVLAHGGGALMSLRGRLRHAHAFQPQAGARLEGSTDDSIRRFFFDTVTHDPELLRQLVEYAGAEQVLLGSDYPFDMGDPRAADTVRAAGLDRQSERAVLCGNAARLLGLAAPRTEKEMVQ